MNDELPECVPSGFSSPLERSERTYNEEILKAKVAFHKEVEKSLDKALIRTSQKDKHLRINLSNFLKALQESPHTYGTIVDAVVEGMLATFRMLDQSKSGGITGFQASCILSSFINKFYTHGKPFVLVDLSSLVFSKKSLTDILDNELTLESRNWFKKEAQRLLDSQNDHLAKYPMNADDKTPYRKRKEYWEKLIKTGLPPGFKAEPQDAAEEGCESQDNGETIGEHEPT